MNNTYTTIKGNRVELTPRVWSAIHAIANHRFDGSQRLFDACWTQYREHLLRGSIDDPENLDDVMDWLETIASEKVNNSASSFYIYGK